MDKHRAELDPPLPADQLSALVVVDESRVAIGKRVGGKERAGPDLAGGRAGRSDRRIGLPFARLDGKQRSVHVVMPSRV